MAGPAAAGSGTSVTTASVVSTIAATLAEFSTAGTRNLRRINDAALQHVAPDTGVGVEAPVVLGDLGLGDDDIAGVAGVGGNRANGLFERSPDDLRTGELVTAQIEVGENLCRPDENGPAARDDAFFHSCASRRECIFDAGLLLLQLDLGGRANLDDRYAAGELGEPLLELLAVKVRGGLFHPVP